MTDDSESRKQPEERTGRDRSGRPASERAGDRVGGYRLLERIGEGSFGVVYVAEQKEPFKRRVALKIIKLGMESRPGGGRL